VVGAAGVDLLALVSISTTITDLGTRKEPQQVEISVLLSP
jgi:hypothetical protein